MKSFKLLNIGFSLGLIAMLLVSSPLFAHDAVTAGDTDVTADIAPTDADIVDNIQSEVILDDEVSNNDVRITAKNGVVTLEGYMDSPEEANELIDVARSAPGVIRVDTPRLKIGPEIVPDY